MGRVYFCGICGVVYDLEHNADVCQEACQVLRTEMARVRSEAAAEKMRKAREAQATEEP